jgi:hypothetical protein
MFREEAPTLSVGGWVYVTPSGHFAEFILPVEEKHDSLVFQKAA